MHVGNPALLWYRQRELLSSRRDGSGGMMHETQPTHAVSVSEGRMTIAGHSDAFVQGIGRHFRLEAKNLRFIGGFASREGRLEEAHRIIGEAVVAAGSLRRAGFDGEAGAIALTLKPFTSGDPARMLLMLGFRDAGDGGGAFFAEAYVAPAVFAALKGDIVSGTAQRLALSATTSLWASEAEREAAAGLPLAWHLGLDADGRASTPARGLIETLDWSAALPVTAEAAPAEEDEPDATPDQLRRINWSLKQLLLVLAFLMIIVALK